MQKGCEYPFQIRTRDDSTDLLVIFLQPVGVLVFCSVLQERRHRMANPWVIASSTTFFVPALVASCYQSILVAIVFFNAALFSTMYHAYGENRYESLDIIWASLALLLALMLIAVLVKRFGVWSWQVLLPMLMGSTAIVLYLTEGNITGNMRPSEYETFHSLWHVLSSIAVTLLAMHPVRLSELDVTYPEVFRRDAKRLK